MDVLRWNCFHCDLDILMLQILNNRRSGMLLIVKTVMTKKVLIDDMAIDHLEFLTNTR